MPLPLSKRTLAYHPFESGAKLFSYLFFFFVCGGETEDTRQRYCLVLLTQRWGDERAMLRLWDDAERPRLGSAPEVVVLAALLGGGSRGKLKHCVLS